MTNIENVFHYIQIEFCSICIHLDLPGKSSWTMMGILLYETLIF